MRDDDIRAQAHRAGIELRWRDVAGQTHEVAVGVLRAVLDALGPVDDSAWQRPLITGDV
jgi:hypothetical protein